MCFAWSPLPLQHLTHKIEIMKFNAIPAIIAVCLSALIAYAFYSWSSDEMQIVNCASSAIWSLITLGAAIGISYSESRLSANIKVLSFVFFFILLIANIILAVADSSIQACIIIEGILLLMFLLIAHFMNKAK